MKSKTPKCNPLGWVWVEMHGFESEEDRFECLQLLNEGYTQPFKKFLLKVAYAKIWFRVRQSERKNIAWLNGPFPNHCTRLLCWLRASKRHDGEFRERMGWPTDAYAHASAIQMEPARESPQENADKHERFDQTRDLH